MAAPTITMTVDYAKIVELVDQLSADQKRDLLLHLSTQSLLPSQTLTVFHVDRWPEHMTLRREDEYDDDGR